MIYVPMYHMSISRGETLSETAVLAKGRAVQSSLVRRLKRSDTSRLGRVPTVTCLERGATCPCMRRVGIDRSDLDEFTSPSVSLINDTIR